MKILHTSDWHLGKSLYDFPLLDEQSQFLDWLLELLAARPVDAILIAGDVYDRPVPPGRAVALYDRFLSRAVLQLHVKVLAVAGNHDSAARLGFGSGLYGLTGYHVTGAPQSPAHTVTLRDAFGPVEFVLLPYLHPAEARALFPGEQVATFDDACRVLLAQQPVSEGVRRVAVAHGFFGDTGDAAAREPLIFSDSEISIGGMDIVDCARFTGFDYVALGHLHAPQRAGPAARYSGSPLKYSLSEERQRKSVSLVTLDADGVADVELIPVPQARGVRTVRGTMDTLLEPSMHENQAFDDYVFAEIDGPECPYPMQKLRTLFPRLLGLRFMDGAEPRAPVLNGPPAERYGQACSVEELFARFYGECRGHELPPAHQAVLRDVLAELEQGDAP